MASVLLVLENLGEDKHVESVWLPRLDEGSTPSSSTELLDPWKSDSKDFFVIIYRARLIYIASFLGMTPQYLSHLRAEF